MSDAVVPFHSEVAQADLDDLRDRLARTRWPDELPGVGWDHGVPLERLRALAAYWQDGFSWRDQEAKLNAHPQFTTVIDDQKIHFLHVRSPHPDALPLLLTHGWPGSVLEFLHVIDPLTDPGDPADAFHVVIPAIPGFGFSGPTATTGWDAHRVAGLWTKLMARLGYERYGVQGGDWGSLISRVIGGVDPGRVAGVHLNFLVTLLRGAPVDLSDEDEARLAAVSTYLANPAGYLRQQTTRPQTLAYALTDSPVGQLAWIAEKFQEWTDPGVTVDDDWLLTNVSLYWLTRTAGSAARIYYESAALRGKSLHCPVPAGVAVFPHELVQPVRALAERDLDIVHWTEMDRGGHFAALEVPDLFVRDVREFFAKVR
ncbi:epoxide hydrolase family protein [Kibdelosporangium phytohabitans]|uniref:Epoxide hydrolase n=1 Tax=Kibdelosporangium phytohabitans TaxID=860235 RepID=A0A0N9I9I0_9PSEU|nr:epoxide hydrolase family protein [Kibdelosporangium phytohabitans]ALG15096.1 epoxide hydrolase [Kibdelosporangium phytohabitans]MBE1461072.1 pimeloyl-ACP methyl ester carboxylesterase [Kibdelosporangium phytohabitans]